MVFLRQVIEGGAEKSFGIHVAQLAGLPAHVIARAEVVLQGLEESRQSTATGPKKPGDGEEAADGALDRTPEGSESVGDRE